MYKANLKAAIEGLTLVGFFLILSFFSGKLFSADTNDLEAAYQRATDLLPFNVPNWLTHHATYDAVWSDDSDRFAWRSRGPDGRRWHIGNAKTGKTEIATDVPDFAQNDADLNLSPDGKLGVAYENYNLWLVDTVTGKRSPLTTDGEKRYGYSILYYFGIIDSEGRNHQEGPMTAAFGAWSPDGRYFASYRYNQRDLKTQHYWYAVTQGGYGARPKRIEQAVSFPQDEKNAVAELVIIDVEKGDIIDIDEGLIETFFNPFMAGLVRWSKDSKSLYFFQEGRGQKEITVKVFDLLTQKTTPVFSEKSKDGMYLMLCDDCYPAMWDLMDDDKSLLWYSERSGWGNLYKVDLATGKILHNITEGKGEIRRLLKLDEANGYIYFTGSGREEGVDPYYRQFYRARLDGKGTQLLTPEQADHVISISPNARTFLDVQSRGFSKSPKTVLRSLDGGDEIATIVEVDFTPLQKRNWQPPQRIVVRDANDQHDVYVSVFFPSDYNADEQYPVLDFIYALSSLAESPYTFPIGAPFELSNYFWRAQSIAELGFIVVMLDAPGTPFRGYDYMRESYGAGHIDSTIKHRIAAIKQLADDKGLSLDLDRVGAFGYSGGGFTSVRAMLFYPDFYKVAVAAAGAHDFVRLYDRQWGDRYIGLYEDNKDIYDKLSNTTYADQLAGKLLLIHGEADSEVPPIHTQQFVHALIEANKDFDLLYIPNADHYNMNMHPYFIRKRWDYFVQHLLNEQPPENFKISVPDDVRCCDVE